MLVSITSALMRQVTCFHCMCVACREWKAAAASVSTAAVIPGVCCRRCGPATTNGSAWVLDARHIAHSCAHVTHQHGACLFAQQQSCQSAHLFMQWRHTDTGLPAYPCLTGVPEGRRAAWEVSG